MLLLILRIIATLPCPRRIDCLAHGAMAGGWSFPGRSERDHRSFSGILIIVGRQPMWHHTSKQEAAR